MLITLNIWVILFTCGLVVGLFLLSLFVLFRKKYPAYVFNITTILFILCLILFEEIAEESNMVDTYPFLIGMTMAADLLIWPICLFFVQHLTGKRNSYNWKDGIYFIPFVVGFAWNLSFLALPASEKMSYFSSGIPPDIAWFVAFKFLIVVFFAIWTIKVLVENLQMLGATFPNNRKARFMGQVKLVLTGLFLCVFGIYTLFFLNYLYNSDLGDSDKIGSLIISSLIFLFAVLIFRSPGLLQKVGYSESIKKFFKNSESRYIHTLIQLFSDEKPYLEEKLAIRDVAALMELTPQQLSYLVNKQLGVSFSDFVNTYRVKEFQSKLSEGCHLHRSLLDIALECGFNGKASFNRIFKKQTGCTPSDFLKKEVSFSN